MRDNEGDRGSLAAAGYDQSVPYPIERIKS